MPKANNSNYKEFIFIVHILKSFDAQFLKFNSRLDINSLLTIWNYSSSWNKIYTLYSMVN